jgi:hypothetical protein
MNKVCCPYCGGIMTLAVDSYSDGTVAGAYYECLDCKAGSPYIEDAGDAEDIKEAAHAAAMQRWREPNRVLTLEEILALDPNGATCVESRRGEIEAQLNSELQNEANATVEDYGIDNARKMYGKYARAWLRRPTDEERAGAGWDLNHGEESENG